VQLYFLWKIYRAKSKIDYRVKIDDVFWNIKCF